MSVVNLKEGFLLKNPMKKTPILMKFGGTSVENAKAILNLISIVKSKKEQGFSPILVVSAMGKMTDRLLFCANLAKENQLEKAKEIVRDEIRILHFNTVGVLLKGAENEEEIRRRLDLLLEELKDLLTGISLYGELTQRFMDTFLSYGERLSTLIISEALKFHKVAATLCDSRKVLVTDSHFSKAVPDLHKTKNKLEEIVKPIYEADSVPVLQGFVGSDENGITTTLGRGGSDFSAAIFGSLLNVAKIEIWTDVSGVLTTDPRICPEAKAVKAISFKEASELAYFGAKVLHPSTIRPAIERRIPVYILNSKKPQEEGTKITKNDSENSEEPKAIAFKEDLVNLQVIPFEMMVRHAEFLSLVTGVFARNKVNVDAVAISESGVGIVFEKTAEFDRVKQELRLLGEIKVSENVGLVGIVGKKFWLKKDSLELILHNLMNFKIYVFSQGTFGIVLSFVVESKDLKKVIKNLHKLLFEK